MRICSSLVLAALLVVPPASAAPKVPAAVLARLQKIYPDDRQAIEIAADWMAQDRLFERGRIRTDVVAKLVESLGDSATKLRDELDALELEKAPDNDPRRIDVYLQACELRRAARFAPFRHTLGRIVFTKHYDLGGSHYAYTEGQSDAQRERHFKPGAALCILHLTPSPFGGGPRRGRPDRGDRATQPIPFLGTVTTLVEDKGGVIRDPDVSFDASRILYAHKKDLNKDDYHLYERDLATGKTRQLTSGLGVADYEGAYLPNGQIVFNSSRCVQIVDCWWTEVSNLYTCDGAGRYLRRLSFDQVHTNYPTVVGDGRVIYTRWDYSDRGQIYPQGLFQMNGDGTNQTALYGNNSFFPTTILHARGIPGSEKIVCVFSGHHTRQNGWLALIDPRRGREEADGAQLIAPVRETKAVRIDRYGQSGDQFQYPYPFDEEHFLVAMRPAGARRFAIYFIDAGGRRELLVSDPRTSCNQPVPLAPRPVPHHRPNLVDYRKSTATVFLQDIYRGPGLKGVPRGTIKGLRVVSPQFRAAGVGSNGNRGPAGGALVSTPVSIQGAWDPKVVLGTAKVHPDGSAFFTVPARMPLYFQALDAKGHAVQTMRSWSTLQPGERLSCVGCHEAKGAAPPAAAAAQALFAGPQTLEPFFDGPPRGFSFIRDVQPVLDRLCVRCHNQRGKGPGGKTTLTRPAGKPFDPKTMRFVAPIGPAAWRYTTRKPARKWFKTGFDDSAWAEAPGGFGDRGVPGARAKTPWKTRDIWLRRTFDIGATPRAPALILHHDDDAEVYVNGQLAGRFGGFTTRYEVMPIPQSVACTIAVGQNTLAVHCVFKGGGRYIDAGIVDVTAAPPRPVIAKPPSEIKPAFSLLGAQTLEGRSCRKWSDAYVALVNRRVCNWVNAQSAPPMLAPYGAGAAKSKLITLLEEGHYGVKLSARDLLVIATWIDLLVPYSGTYTEAMDERHIPRYQQFQAKRDRLKALDEKNIQAFIAAQ